MANLLEITVRYGCDDCGDEFTIDYQEASEIEDEVDHDGCPADECAECGCDCGDCTCDSEECRHCGCGEDEEEEAEEE